GVATLRACGYDAPVSPLVSWTGAATVILAPFGAYALNLAAITAAISAGPQAHEDPSRRYVAAVAAGVFYLVMGASAAMLGAILAAFPRELVIAVAGLALINTIGGGLAGAMREESDREPALATFLVTASGTTLWGIGSAFWGLVAGGLTMLALRLRRSPRAYAARQRPVLGSRHGRQQRGGFRIRQAGKITRSVMQLEGCQRRLRGIVGDP